MEHSQIASPWLFYGLGYIGIVLYILRGVMKIGLTLDILPPFLKGNALAIIATVVTYNAIVGMWMYSDAFAFFGLIQGELNGMSIFVAFAANEIFADLADKQKERLAQKNTPPVV